MHKVNNVLGIVVSEKSHRYIVNNSPDIQGCVVRCQGGGAAKNQILSLWLPITICISLLLSEKSTGLAPGTIALPTRVLIGSRLVSTALPFFQRAATKGLFF